MGRAASEPPALIQITQEDSAVMESFPQFTEVDLGDGTGEGAVGGNNSTYTYYDIPVTHQRRGAEVLWPGLPPATRPKKLPAPSEKSPEKKL